MEDTFKGYNTSIIAYGQTGSGKTLAYLLPLLQRALQAPSNKLNGAPKILILAPTAELADQLRGVCDKIAMSVPFKTMVVTATGKLKTSIKLQKYDFTSDYFFFLSVVYQMYSLKD